MIITTTGIVQEIGDAMDTSRTYLNERGREDKYSGS